MRLFVKKKRRGMRQLEEFYSATRLLIPPTNWRVSTCKLVGLVWALLLDCVESWSHFDDGAFPVFERREDA
jgi:hypothetical protein